MNVASMKLVVNASHDVAEAGCAANAYCWNTTVIAATAAHRTALAKVTLVVPVKRQHRRWSLALQTGLSAIYVG